MKMKLVVLSCVFASGLQGAAFHPRLQSNSEQLGSLKAELENCLTDAAIGLSQEEIAQHHEARANAISKLQRHAVLLVQDSLDWANLLGLDDLIYYKRLHAAAQKPDALLGKSEDLFLYVNMLSYHAGKRAEKIDALNDANACYFAGWRS